jgi:hypothetical protein
VTCRPGNETVLSKEKADQSPSRRYRQNRALSDTAPPPEFLRSGYALPSSPRRRRSVILIVAGSSSRLSRESLASDAFAPKKWRRTTKLHDAESAIFALPLVAAAVGYLENGKFLRVAIRI